jgi:hypothetical protein
MDLVPDPKLKGRDASYNTHLAVESDRSTDKADSFADDNSTATLANAASLGNLKNFVEEFAGFSGLHSNADKTTLLQIGRIAPLDPEVINLGFNIVNEVNLLGIMVDNNLTMFTNHFETVIQKVTGIIEYWERFYLSLAGRINVCKTFMLSQIGYAGSFITPNNNQIKRLQDLMDNFCLNNLRIARKKLYLSPCTGGLGLINVKNYIKALQCSWIKRVSQHWCDNWRYDIKKASYGNPLICNGRFFTREDNPALHNICESFGTFSNEFYKKDRNFRKALIFKNPIFKRGRGDDGILDENFFGRNYTFEDFKKIACITYDDFFSNGRQKTLDMLCDDTGINFNLVTYMRIHEALQFYKNTRGNVEPAPEQSVKFFLKTFTRGSGPYRRILEYGTNSKEKIENNNTVRTFINFLEIQVPEESVLRACWSAWNRNYFGNRQREFLFKFYNNILGVNARVAHFVPGHSAECTVCVINDEPAPRQAETFLHVFYECYYTSRYRQMAESDFFPEISPLTESQKRAFWLLGIIPTNIGYVCNQFIQSAVFCINYLIWKIKLSKSRTPVSIFREDFVFMCRNLLSKSGKLREVKTNSHFFLCRQNL